MTLKRCFFALALTIATLTSATSFAALTGEYKFEDAAPNTATDTSGNARNGTFAGTSGLPTYGPGLYTGSTSSLRLNSDGSAAQLANAQKVVLPGSTNYITNATGATLTGWVKLEGTLGTTNKTIISISNGDPAANSGSGATRATIQINGSNNQFRALGRKDDITGQGSSSVQSGAGLVAQTGQTYFVAGVFNYVGGYVRLFVGDTTNPLQIFNANIAAWTTNSANSANLTTAIGTTSPPSSTQEYWHGLLDGIRVFNTPLTNEQIAAMYADPDLVPGALKPGDVDNNGVVDINDLIPIRQNYLQTVANRSFGDLTDDLTVNFADFRQWKTAFVTGGGSLDDLDLGFASVPEPGAIALVGMSLLVFLPRRNRRQTKPAHSCSA
jgi:hypothetical protein